MALKCGIVGLPNVGKSTLFNCLSSAKAQAANFPFCTIEPNVGVITVPDERLTTEVYLYNINGQMVYRHQQNNPDQVSINLNDLGLQPGVYVYNVKIKSASSKYSTNAGKIIVTK